MKMFKFEVVRSKVNGEFFIEVSKYEKVVDDYVIFDISDGYDSFGDCMSDLNKFINKIEFNYNSDEIIFKSNNISLI